MSFIASIILQDRIIQVSDSRAVSEIGNSITVEDDNRRKLFQLKDNIGIAYCGVQEYGILNMERALERFKTTENLNLPPVQLADKLRDYLAEYWRPISKGLFCFQMGGYYQGRPFGLARYNPIPPAHLLDQAHAPMKLWVMQYIGSNMKSVSKALSGMKVPPFNQIPPAQVVNYLVDIVFTVIELVPSCGGDVQAQIITPSGITDFRAPRSRTSA